MPFAGKLAIRWKQTKTRLSGTIALSSQRGRYAIGGTITPKGIKFGAVSVGAVYTAKVSGPTMSGTWQSPQGGGTWSAHRMGVAASNVKTIAKPKKS